LPHFPYFVGFNIHFLEKIVNLTAKTMRFLSKVMQKQKA